MAGTAPPGWYDISLPLKQGMHNLILDPVKPKIYRLHEAELGSPVTITMLEMLSHTGTHIDCPRHFIPDGSTVTDMALDATIGPAGSSRSRPGKRSRCRNSKSTTSRRASGSSARRSTRPGCTNHRLGLRTMSTLVRRPPPTLRKRRSSLGMDCITVGYFNDNDSIVRTHMSLLTAGVYILEGCALADVPPGDRTTLSAASSAQGRRPLPRILRPLVHQLGRYHSADQQD